MFQVHLHKRLMSSAAKRFSQAYINGTWVGSAGGTFDVTNPATNEIITKVADCSTQEAEKAVKSAVSAFEKFGFESTANQRHDMLIKAAKLMMEEQETLAHIMTEEMGKPMVESRGEIGYAASFLQWFGEEARRRRGDIVPSGNFTNRQQLVYREPVGVVGIITPWNFPSAMITRKAGAAMAAGCTVVVKPAEDTPLSALALADIFERAGFPSGVFNVLPSSRKNASDIGKFLCESTDIAKISFTGSTAVGKILLAQSASTVKRVSMELGGNAPFIVFDSADVQLAVQGAMASKFRNAGQTCVCANRLFVQSGIYDEFVKKLTEETNKLVVGNGLEQGVTQGPLINQRAVDKVSGMVKNATDLGAEVQCGGKAAKNVGANYFQPTILTNISKDMEVANLEIFGPVAPVIKFTDENEVLKLANATRVGLAGYFYSRDISQIFRVARRMEVGMIGVNEGVISSCEAPFGGVKESGIGVEGSHLGMAEYESIKYVCVGGL